MTEEFSYLIQLSSKLLEWVIIKLSKLQHNDAHYDPLVGILILALVIYLGQWIVEKGLNMCSHPQVSIITLLLTFYDPVCIAYHMDWLLVPYCHIHACWDSCASLMCSLWKTFSLDSQDFIIRVTSLVGAIWQYPSHFWFVVPKMTLLVHAILT